MIKRVKKLIFDVDLYLYNHQQFHLLANDIKIFLHKLLTIGGIIWSNCYIYCNCFNYSWIIIFHIISRIMHHQILHQQVKQLYQIYLMVQIMKHKLNIFLGNNNIIFLIDKYVYVDRNIY